MYRKKKDVLRRNRLLKNQDRLPGVITAGIDQKVGIKHSRH